MRNEILSDLPRIDTGVRKADKFTSNTSERRRFNPTPQGRQMPIDSARTSGGFTPAAVLAAKTAAAAEAAAATEAAVAAAASLSSLWSSSDEEGRMYRPSSIEESGNQTGAACLSEGLKHQVVGLSLWPVTLIGLQPINLPQINNYFLPWRH